MTRPKAAAARDRRKAAAEAPSPTSDGDAPAPAPAPTGRASPLGGTSIARPGRASPLGGTSITAGRRSPLGGTSITAGRTSPKLGGTSIAGATRRPSTTLSLNDPYRPSLGKRPRAPGADALAVLTQQPANDDGQRLSEFCTTYKKKAGAKGMTKRPKQEKPPRPPLIQPPAEEAGAARGAAGPGAHRGWPVGRGGAAGP